MNNKNYTDIYNNAEFKFKLNPRRQTTSAYPDDLLSAFSPASMSLAQQEISSWPGYQPTPLHSLNQLAEQIGIKQILYKDEGQRFGLASFKALGGAYAVSCVLADAVKNSQGHKPDGRELAAGHFKAVTEQITVVTATDGNHGRSVAWGAQRFGCQCRIYIHAEVSEFRQQAMQQLGATVIRINGDYDESVRLAAEEAAANNWIVVSDTTYPGYLEIPCQVMVGYTVMTHEILQQLEHSSAISHVFIQGGVGGLAAAVCAGLRQQPGENRPQIIVVEPDLASCLYQSNLDGQAAHVEVRQETLMAGMSCGETSLLAWQILDTDCDAFMTITDDTGT